MPIVNLTTSFLGIIPPNNPVVTFVSATGDSITVNITNPNEYPVKAYYGHTNPNPTLNTTISANSNQNVTVSGLTGGINYTIYVYLENTENNSKSATVSVLASTPAELYAFTSQNFTSAGVTGRTGPNLTQCRTAYSSASWTQNNSFFNMTTNGIQLWTVPVSATYRIETWGAQGGNSGGLGARMRGDFQLTQGEIIEILVGQQAVVKNTGCNQGGGGGTFVWRQNSTSLPLIVSGGGGGAGNGCGTSGENAPTTNNGTGSFAGSNGNGGSPGGAGWNSNGGTGLDNANNGNLRPLAGGTGGFGNTSNVGDGGFGGGAGASGQSCGNGGPGGGGGYSGGGGPSTNTSCQNSGGGGSYNSGSNQSNSAGVQSGNGTVTITKL